MSKVISFSISDRYLDKLRSLYPSLTDNLAVKQFVTDGLDGSLGNSLDVSLDDGLDDRVKTLIESWVDGLLEVRLDASVGKLITSLSERMARLEERLDDGLDGRLDESIARLGSCFSHRLLGLEKRLDEMELLLRMQREASIATSPIVEPTGEPSPLPPSPPDRPAISEPDQPAIETVTREVSPSPPGAIASIDGTVETVSTDSSIETVAIKDSEKKITLLDTSIASPIETVESGSESISSINEPDTDAIETVPGDSDSSIETVTDAIELTNKQKAAILGIDNSNLSKWVRNGEIPKKHGNKCRFNENKTKIILI